MESIPIETAAEVPTFSNPNLAEGLPDHPLVTFALFAYNQEHFIREAVEGALSQTYSPLEIILSDDCSTDRTYEIIKELAARYEGPHRIQVERTHRNLGKEKFGRRVWRTLRQANGELIVIGGGDDVSLPNRCQSLLSVWDLHGRGRVCIHSKAFVIDENGNPHGSPVGNNAISRCSLADFVSKDGRGLLGATNAVSKSLLNAFGPLADRLLLEDGALAFRARLCDGILFTEDCLVKYRRHSANMTGPEEFMSQASIQRNSLGLMSQQVGYLSDYLSVAVNPDVRVIKSGAKRLLHAEAVRRFKTGNLWQRLCAGYLLSSSSSMKRRIWLSLLAAGLVGVRRR